MIRSRPPQVTEELFRAELDDLGVTVQRHREILEERLVDEVAGLKTDVDKHRQTLRAERLAREELAELVGAHADKHVEEARKIETLLQRTKQTEVRAPPRAAARFHVRRRGTRTRALASEARCGLASLCARRADGFGGPRRGDRRQAGCAGRGRAGGGQGRAQGAGRRPPGAREQDAGEQGGGELRPRQGQEGARGHDEHRDRSGAWRLLTKPCTDCGAPPGLLTHARWPRAPLMHRAAGDAHGAKAHRLWPRDGDQPAGHRGGDRRDGRRSGPGQRLAVGARGRDAGHAGGRGAPAGGHGQHAPGRGAWA